MLCTVFEVCTHIDTPVSCVEGMHEPQLPTVFAVVTSMRFGYLLGDTKNWHVVTCSGNFWLAVKHGLLFCSPHIELSQCKGSTHYRPGQTRWKERIWAHCKHLPRLEGVPLDHLLTQLWRCVCHGLQYCVCVCVYCVWGMYIYWHTCVLCRGHAWTSATYSICSSD